MCQNQGWGGGGYYFQVFVPYRYNNCAWPTNQEKYETLQLQNPRPLWFRPIAYQYMIPWYKQCGGHRTECWALLGQVQSQMGHPLVSGAVGPSALMLHLPSPAHLYMPCRPGPLPRGSPCILVQHLPSEGSRSTYCALRPHHKMGQSQEKHAGWCCLPAQGLHPWRNQGPQVAAPTSRALGICLHHPWLLPKSLLRW